MTLYSTPREAGQGSFRHVGYDNIEPWIIQRVDLPPKNETDRSPPKALLGADRAKAMVDVDSGISLRDVPEEASDYKLGNRSALEWVLDQHKSESPKTQSSNRLSTRTVSPELRRTSSR